jgi:integrase
MADQPIAVEVTNPPVALPPARDLVATPRDPAVPDRTVADLIAEVILRGKSARTRRAYRADLTDFLVWLMGYAVQIPMQTDELRQDTPASRALNATLGRLQTVTEGDISAYCQHLATPEPPPLGTTEPNQSAPRCAPATINRRLTPLRLLFQRLQRYHLIALNPMDYIKGHKLSAVSETVYLSRSEARLLEDSCAGTSLKDLRDQTLIVLMLSTGLRASETVGLQIADLTRIDEHAVVWLTGKGNRRERVKLPPHVQRQLRAYLEAAGITVGPIFRRLHATGSFRRRDGAVGAEPRGYTVGRTLSYAGLYKILRARFVAAQLDARLTPHGLRHSFITLAIKGGASIAQTQAAARHQDPRMTIRYAHDLDALDDNAVDYVRY